MQDWLFSGKKLFINGLDLYRGMKSYEIFFFIHSYWNDFDYTLHILITKVYSNTGIIFPGLLYLK